MAIRFGPDGVHLFDRKSGLNILLDEIRPPLNLWSQGPQQVSIALTNRCDLRCPHCYAPKTPNRLELGTLKQWLLELDSAGTLGVGFGGGEPTLFPNFAELCRFTATETSLAVTFTTHGHHLSKDMIRSLKGSVHFFRISLDGIGATYQKMRGRSFADIVKILRVAKELAPFGVNVVVNEITVHQLPELAQIAEEVGATELLMLPQQPTSAVEGSSHACSQTMRDWALGYRGALRLTISEAGAFDFPICNPLPLETGIRGYAHIDAAGQLRANSFDPFGVEISASGIISAVSELAKTSAESS